MTEQQDQSTHDIVIRNMHRYLEQVIAQIPTTQHEMIRGLFQKHMSQVSDYCTLNIITQPILTTVAIRGLHKILSPDGQQRMRRHEKGYLVVYCMPGHYKTLPNSTASHIFPDKRNHYTEPHLVKSEMESLVTTLNTKLTETQSHEEIHNIILRFMVDFFEIHPFGDDNGKVAYILVDLLLIKNGLRPIFLNAISDEFRESFFRSIEQSALDKNILPLLDFIRAYRPDALEI